MTVDEIGLAYLLLKYLRGAAHDRPVYKFNVIGKSAKGEVELWLRRDILPPEKQSLIWIWDELKRTRLIEATGTDLSYPDDWVVVSPKGLTVSESDFAAIFDERSDGARATERLVDVVTGILQRAELDVDLRTLGQTDTTLPLSFLMIDLDHFKDFIDSYGHLVGDEVLRSVAQCIAKTVRGKGEVYRYGGEEIAVILPNHSSAEATAVAERIRQEIETVRIAALPDCCITASLGVATVPETSAIFANLVIDADRALYQAKDDGRNQVHCASKQTSGTLIERKRAAPVSEVTLPNVVFIQARVVNLAYDQDRGDSFHEVESHRRGGDMIGVIACFRNEAIYGKQVDPVHNARAHLQLVDSEGKEIGTGFSGALWLGHKTALFDLEPGGRSGCVILLISDGKDFIVPYKTRQNTWQGDTINDGSTELKELPQMAEVSVLDSSRQLVSKPIRLEITSAGNKIQVNAVPPSEFLVLNVFLPASL